MKSHSAPFFPLALVTAGFATLTLFGCAKQDRDAATSKVTAAYQDSKNAVVDSWNDVKANTFEKRDDFSADAKARMAKMDAQASELRAKDSGAQASDSRKAAWMELKNSQVDFKGKVDALGQATADTWDSAKQNTVTSWDRLSAAYDKARAD